jgi:hypothetical protein
VGVICIQGNACAIQGDATPHGMCTPFPVIRCVKSLRRVALVRTICIAYCRRQGAFSLIRGFVREAIVG